MLTTTTPASILSDGRSRSQRQGPPRLLVAPTAVHGVGTKAVERRDRCVLGGPFELCRAAEPQRMVRVQSSAQGIHMPQRPPAAPQSLAQTREDLSLASRPRTAVQMSPLQLYSIYHLMRAIIQLALRKAAFCPLRSRLAPYTLFQGLSTPHSCCLEREVYGFPEKWILPGNGTNTCGENHERNSTLHVLSAATKSPPPRIRMAALELRLLYLKSTLQRLTLSGLMKRQARRKRSPGSGPSGRLPSR